MAEYDPRAELMATQQSLLKEYEHQLNKEIEENVAILSCLLQYEQVREQVPWQKLQQALKREKKNTSKLVAMQKLNEELLSVAEEQHWQWMYVLSLVALSQKVKLRNKKGKDQKQKQPQQK